MEPVEITKKRRKSRTKNLELADIPMETKKTETELAQDEPIMQELAQKKVKVKPKVPFDIWFSNKLAAKEVRFYEDEILKVFFKKQGLSNVEYADTYEDYFRKF